MSEFQPSTIIPASTTTLPSASIAVCSRSIFCGVVCRFHATCNCASRPRTSATSFVLMSLGGVMRVHCRAGAVCPWHKYDKKQQQARANAEMRSFLKSVSNFRAAVYQSRGPSFIVLILWFAKQHCTNSVPTKQVE